MNDELSPRILAALTRIPDWLWRGLLSKDTANRQRAEEALSTIIAAALGEHTNS